MNFLSDALVRMTKVSPFRQRAAVWRNCWKALTTGSENLANSHIFPAISNKGSLLAAWHPLLWQGTPGVEKCKHVVQPTGGP